MDNAKAKRKRTKEQIMIYIKLHRKLKIGQRESRYKHGGSQVSWKDKQSTRVRNTTQHYTEQIKVKEQRFYCCSRKNGYECKCT
jgi:hypothetical protein